MVSGLVLGISSLSWFGHGSRVRQLGALLFMLLFCIYVLPVILCPHFLSLVVYPVHVHIF